MMFVGTSGFSYTSWRGKFYPSDLKSEDFLSYYSKQLNSVEINNSFYASPSPGMIRTWSGKTSDSFRFAFKAPRQITHILKLEGKLAVEASHRLEQSVNLLGEKRGPLLFQLPPYLRQDLPRLESFLNHTSGMPGRVFEFRHNSWMTDETYKLLDKYYAGFCVAETEDMAPVLHVTGGLAYFRLRKDQYDQKTIVDWSKKIGELSKGLDQTYVYLRHDETGENAGLALRLLGKQ
jgi:uncharacterized protein YecE (DUF72 family)